jgi:hypothetical protein
MRKPFSKSEIQDLRDDLATAQFEYTARHDSDRARGLIRAGATAPLHEARTALYKALKANEQAGA